MSAAPTGDCMLCCCRLLAERDARLEARHVNMVFTGAGSASQLSHTSKVGIMQGDAMYRQEYVR